MLCTRETCHNNVNSEIEKKEKPLTKNKVKQMLRIIEKNKIKSKGKTVLS